MDGETLSFDVKPFSNGLFYFRFPAGDETAEWSDPFSSYEAAETAAIETVEAFLATSVLAALGLN